MKFHLSALVLVAAISGCGAEPRHSATQAFSASPTAANQAIMMTAPSYTPGYAGMFNQDLANLKAVLSDPKGNYHFNVVDQYYVGHYQMENSIAVAANKVSADGTLMIFITAHGAPQGLIQPEGQSYATFGYRNILDAIRRGRKDLGKFKRFVLFISACYSGSWLSQLQQGVEEFADERLVFSSVDPYNLSTIGAATSAMYQTFAQYKDRPGTTMRTFLAAYQQRHYLGQWRATPDSMLDEPLVHAQ